ncbi:MAG: DUF3431 domain-containing protein [Salinibacterium sp.]|nr:DUF3431 domain-containing protein [Planctomycetota bacterium]MCB1282637.1 DUF3431 domain-containing protein [Salinibacterium sp.]
MADLELVVARYAEDLKWLRRVPRAFRITVYDKGGDLENAIPLRNVGYEAHTYLHHVVTRFDDLADLTVFVQGRPFDHVPDLHRRLRRLAEGRESVDAFRWLGFVVDYDDSRGERLFRPWSKNVDGRFLDLEGFCQSLWGESAPETFVFYPGGQFGVRAEQIRRQPASFYERALDLSLNFPDGGHCLERTWDRVFDAHGVPPSLRGRPLPIYLRPIRRLGITWDSVPVDERGW